MHARPVEMDPPGDGVPDNTRPFSSLGESLNILLGSLREMVPAKRWSAARHDEAGWTLLDSAPRETAVREGQSTPELVCLRLAEDMKPRFIPDAMAAENNADSAALAAAGIAACIICPLISRRGELLGAIFATDTHAQAAYSAAQRRLVVGLARTLSTLFAYSLRHEEPREARIPGNEPFAGMPNLHAWQSAMEDEEAALVEADEDALAIMIEVDEGPNPDFTDTELAMAHHGALLKTYVRDQDRVARIGRNHFALLLRNLSAEQAQAVLDKIAAALRHADAAAAIGYALRRASGTLPEAFRIADIRMYNEKLRRG